MSTKHDHVGLVFDHGRRQVTRSSNTPGLPSLISTGSTATMMSECSPWLQSRLGVRRPTSGGTTPATVTTSGRCSTPSRLSRHSGRKEPSLESMTLQRIDDDIIRAMAKLSEPRPLRAASREKIQQQVITTRRSCTSQSKPMLRVSLYPPVRDVYQQRQQMTEVAPMFVGSRSGNAALERAITVLRDRQLTVRLMTARSSITRPTSDLDLEVASRKMTPELYDEEQRNDEEADSNMSAITEADVGRNTCVDITSDRPTNNTANKTSMVMMADRNGCTTTVHRGHGDDDDVLETQPPPLLRHALPSQLPCDEYIERRQNSPNTTSSLVVDLSPECSNQRETEFIKVITKELVPLGRQESNQCEADVKSSEFLYLDMMSSSYPFSSSISRPTTLSPATVTHDDLSGLQAITSSTDEHHSNKNNNNNNNNNNDDNSKKNETESLPEVVELHLDVQQNELKTSSELTVNEVVNEVDVQDNNTSSSIVLPSNASNSDFIDGTRRQDVDSNYFSSNLMLTHADAQLVTSLANCIRHSSEDTRPTEPALESNVIASGSTMAEPTVVASYSSQGGDPMPRTTDDHGGVTTGLDSPDDQLFDEDQTSGQRRGTNRVVRFDDNATQVHVYRVASPDTARESSDLCRPPTETDQQFSPLGV